MDAQGIPVPLMVAAGGGGAAAVGRFVSRPDFTSTILGKGFNAFLARLGISGQSIIKGAGIIHIALNRLFFLIQMIYDFDCY